MKPYSENPEIGETPMTTKKSLIVLGCMIFLILLSLALPAKWFGIETKKSSYKKLNLVLLSDKTSQKSDITWNDLVKDNLSEKDLQVFKAEKTNPAIITQLNDPNNLTASFSKNLYIASTYLDKNPNSTEADKKELINQLIEEEKKKITLTTYTNKDIHVTTSENKDSIKKYGNEIAGILGDVVTERSMTENIVGIREYLKDQDKANLVPLLKDYDKVDITLQKLLAMKVPLSSSLYHLLVINKIALYRDTLFNLSELPNDPMRATLFIDSYLGTVAETLRIYLVLSDYFKSQGVTFGTKEAGTIFTVGYTPK